VAAHVDRDKTGFEMLAEGTNESRGALLQRVFVMKAAEH
jgi:hypothetical protein